MLLALIGSQVLETQPDADFHLQPPERISVYDSPPNKPLDLTPLRVEQDRVDFDSQRWLDCFPALSGRRG
jgi:hypothetical protein